jgi:hypothetical protein
MKLFNFPWTVQKKQKTSAEKKLEELRDLLFPELKLEEELDETGEVIKFHIDYGVDSNLDAALVDLQEGYNDGPTQKTISNITKRLYKARKLLGAEAKINKEAKYLVVDDGARDDIADIQATEI